MGNATKSGKKTHLLVIMRREDLAENRYLHNLANRTSIQKRKWLETTYRIYIRDYCGKNSYHNTYAHLITTPPQPTNFDLLGVCDVPKFNLQITPTDSTSTHVIPPAVVSGPKSDSPPTNNQGPLNWRKGKGASFHACNSQHCIPGYDLRWDYDRRIAGPDPISSIADQRCAHL